MKSPRLWRAETQTARADHDYFPTEADITAAFMTAEGPVLAARGVRTVREPACGDGAMARVIVRHGFRVIASDIADRGYGQSGVDMMAAPLPRGAVVITNPPYKDGLPERFVRRCAQAGVGYLALLLKATFFHPQRAGLLWRDHRPDREYKVGWRPDFLGLGGGMLDVTFWVWDFARPAPECGVRILRKDGGCF